MGHLSHLHGQRQRLLEEVQNKCSTLLHLTPHPPSSQISHRLPILRLLHLLSAPLSNLRQISCSIRMPSFVPEQPMWKRRVWELSCGAKGGWCWEIPSSASTRTRWDSAIWQACSQAPAIWILAPTGYSSWPCVRTRHPRFMLFH